MLRKALYGLGGLALLLATYGVALAQDAAEATTEAKSGLLYIAVALAVGLPGIATGYAQAKIGAAGMGAISEDKSLFVTTLILMALPETVVILGFVVSVLVLFA